MKAKIIHKEINDKENTTILSFICSMTEEEAKERAERNNRVIIGYEVLDTNNIQWQECK